MFPSSSSGGRITEILDLAVDSAIELFVSGPIVMELRGVLAEKFHWSADRIESETRWRSFAAL